MKALRLIAALLVVAACSEPVGLREPHVDRLFQLVCIDSLSPPPPGYYCERPGVEVQVVIPNPMAPDTTGGGGD